MSKKSVRQSKTSLRLAGIVVRILAVLITISSIAISVYIFIFIIFGMLPTIVSIMIDKRIGKSATNSIAAFNLSGMLPFVKSLVESSSPSTLAQNYITDVFVWFFVYGAAAIGWIVIWSIPQICSVFYMARAQQKADGLRKDQQKLVDEWGSSVISSLQIKNGE